MTLDESNICLGRVRRRKTWVAVIALTTAALGMQSRAENPKAGSPGAPDHESAANFTLENDSFFHTDHFYTNGAQIEVKRRTDARFALTKDALADLCVEERNNCDFERILCDPERMVCERRLVESI